MLEASLRFGFVIYMSIRFSKWSEASNVLGYYDILLAYMLAFILVGAIIFNVVVVTCY